MNQSELDAFCTSIFKKPAPDFRSIGDELSGHEDLMVTFGLRAAGMPAPAPVSTALGAPLPLAMQGGGLYSPLAIVIIGGLISSLLLSRLVTPVMYSLLLTPAPAATIESRS